MDSTTAGPAGGATMMAAMLAIAAAWAESTMATTPGVETSPSSVLGERPGVSVAARPAGSSSRPVTR
jgi:hypothetical protein